MMEIRTNTLDGEAWDKYVNGNGRSDLAHLHGWKDVIERCYGHKAFYLEAWDRERLSGVLPLIFINSRLFGRQLASMPYLDTGGWLSETEECAKALVSAAAGLARELKADISLRTTDSSEIGWRAMTEKVAMHLPLERDPQALLKRIPTERRNRIRKAEKNGLKASFRGTEALDDFYAVFSENMKDLGSPVHDIGFFREILSVFKERTGLIIVEDQSGRPLGAGLYFRTGKTVSLPWVSSLKHAFRLYPNITLYWELIKWGCLTGAEVFDFGRSTVNSGTFEFKRQWGAAPVQLYWRYLRPRGGEGRTQDADSAVNRIMIAVWKKLPVSVANAVGPRIRGSISL